MHFDFALLIEDLNFVNVQGRYEVNSEILCSFRERVSADEPVGNQTVGLQIVAQTQMG